MEIVTVMYIVTLSMMGVSFLVILLFVAGKDIWFAFKRKFQPKGCDVYIASNTRKIHYYYQVPKDGVFRVNKLPYITNPEKTMNLTEMEKTRVKESIMKTRQGYKKRILEFQKKIQEISGRLPSIKEDREKFLAKSTIEHYNSVIKTFEGKLRVKQENYFKDKRPAFFYIENDPVPKDFYEYYSALDNKLIDNMVSRNLTEPEQKKVDQDIKNLKLMILIALAAAGAAALLAFQNNQQLTAICNAMGAAC